jgi:hypothetical protein
MATARQARSWARRNKNFMTPYHLGLQRIKSRHNVFVELNKGTDFNDKDMYGVGIIIWNNETQEFQAFSEDKELDGLKKVFSDYNEARAYFWKLERMPAITTKEIETQ